MTNKPKTARMAATDFLSSEYYANYIKSNQGVAQAVIRIGREETINYLTRPYAEITSKCPQPSLENANESMRYFRMLRLRITYNQYQRTIGI